MSSPGAELLAQSRVLEASAARALDLIADARVPAILHADDPAFLSSTKGGLQRILDVVAVWCRDSGAVFHSAPKSVSMSRKGLPSHIVSTNLDALLGLAVSDKLQVAGVAAIIFLF